MCCPAEDQVSVPLEDGEAAKAGMEKRDILEEAEKSPPALIEGGEEVPALLVTDVEGGEVPEGAEKSPLPPALVVTTYDVENGDVPEKLSPPEPSHGILKHVPPKEGEGEVQQVVEELPSKKRKGKE